jgi:GNAT superfamily N-acetyltransferase
VASWLEIVSEVVPMSGPMPDFEALLRRKIEERAALCVRSDNYEGACTVLGGVLLGGTPPHGWIRWLAVRSSCRGFGVGSCLVKAAIEHLPQASTISVDTFCEENIAGQPARRLISATVSRQNFF